MVAFHSEDMGNTWQPNATRMPGRLSTTIEYMPSSVPHGRNERLAAEAKRQNKRERRFESLRASFPVPSNSDSIFEPRIGEIAMAAVSMVTKALGSKVSRLPPPLEYSEG
jgi:hypothetical protein